MKHTPGPWTASGLNVTAYPGGLTVPVLSTKLPREEAEANATLMAASPELFSELSDLIEWLEDNQRSIDGEFSMDSLLKGPRAAIAKATGSEHS